LCNFEGISGGWTNHSEFFDDGSFISEMEISRGIHSIAEGLQYLHTVQRKLHLNISPESIVINATGCWKLCGFGFNLSFAQNDLQKIASPYFLKSVSTSQVRLEPDLKYCGPEFTEGGYNPSTIRYLTPSSDTFSIAVLAYELYKHCLQASVIKAYFKPLIYLLNNDIQQHLFALQQAIEQQLDTSFLPYQLAQLISGLLQMNSSSRLGTSDIINNAYFSTGIQYSLNMIDNISSRDIGTQSSQLIQLQGQIQSFHARILTYSILPSISKLCSVNVGLWVYALPLHVQLSHLVSIEKYKKIAGPYLAKGLAVVAPNEVLQAFLQNIAFIVETFDALFFEVFFYFLFIYLFVT
jgi:SCY1-like protein 2